MGESVFGGAKRSYGAVFPSLFLDLRWDAQAGLDVESAERVMRSQRIDGATYEEVDRDIYSRIVSNHSLLHHACIKSPDLVGWTLRLLA
jgi:hypothetical protein